MSDTMKLGILLSGGGRTLQNLHEHIHGGKLDAEISVVISSSRKCYGVQRARDLGYSVFTQVKRKSMADSEYSLKILDLLQEHHADYIVLAGFLKRFLPGERYKNRCINIHPSLIPAFCGPGYYGSRVHQAVWDRGCRVTGCTVHFVNDDYDAGPIILQKPVFLMGDEDPDTIADLVFDAECEALPHALQGIIQGKYQVVGSRVHNCSGGNS
jgi:phosphoribosylglycinamide formyltransferase-1